MDERHLALLAIVRDGVFFAERLRAFGDMDIEHQRACLDAHHGTIAEGAHMLLKVWEDTTPQEETHG